MLGANFFINFFKYKKNSSYKIVQYNSNENFFLQDSWVKTPNDTDPISIDSYQFNPEYYRSRKVFADIIESKSNIQSYINELAYLKGIFSNLKTLCLSEIGEG